MYRSYLYCKVGHNTGRLRSKKLNTSAVYIGIVVRTHGAKVDVEIKAIKARAEAIQARTKAIQDKLETFRKRQRTA
jgi:hypothetical protein